MAELTSLYSSTNCHGENLLNSIGHHVHVLLGLRWMHEEHEAGIAQFPGNRQRLRRTPPGWKGVLEVNLAAATREACAALGIDGRNDAIAGPAGRQGFRADKSIKLVPGVINM